MTGENKYIENKCCICNTKKNSVLFKKVGEHNLLKCALCNLVYLESYPNTLFNFVKESKSKPKSEVEFWSFPALYKKHQKVFDYFFSQRISRIVRYKKLSDIKSALDIGIGFGFWANYLKSNNIDVYGIDVSKEVIDYCKKSNLRCELCSYEEYETERRFDLICMFDVLEHFVRPDLMLKKVKEQLTEGGLVYIQVPNVLGLRFPFGHSLGLPYHLWQFNPDSIRKLIEASGFEVLEYWSGIQGVIGHYERGGPSLFIRIMWKIANIFKRGNRIQILIRKK